MSKFTDILLVEDDPGDVCLALARRLSSSHQRAYELGANSVVRRHENVEVHAQQYASLGLFWGWANEPPTGCGLQPKPERRIA